MVLLLHRPHSEKQGPRPHSPTQRGTASGLRAAPRVQPAQVTDSVTQKNIPAHLHKISKLYHGPQKEPLNSAGQSADPRLKSSSLGSLPMTPANTKAAGGRGGGVHPLDHSGPWAGSSPSLPLVHSNTIKILQDEDTEAAATTSVFPITAPGFTSQPHLQFHLPEKKQ